MGCVCTGSREERSVTSPRLERASSSSLAQLGQLSLLDKLFDKSKSAATLHRCEELSQTANYSLFRLT